MNKKLHFLLFCLLLIFIVCLCKDKLFNLIEPFGNQIVIHPDTAELNPRETTFSILTYDTDLGSGVTQLSTCSDDSSWRMGEKTCRDYSLSGSNCGDIGDDGKSAFDACKVACDNCNTYTEIKRRLPSPVEEVDEPSYAQFEGSISAEDTGSDIGSADYREIISRLDDMKDSMGTLDRTVGATSNLTQLRLDNMSEELRGSLSGIDADGDGALTTEEFIQFNAERGPLGSRAATANLAIDRIIVQGKNTTERLLEVIRLFKRNRDSSNDSKVPGLPDTPYIDATYEDLERDVQRLKTHIETLNRDTAPGEIIRNIYKIIVYFVRLGLSTVSTPGDTHKSKLGDLEEKKINLLLRLKNIDPTADAATYGTATAAAALPNSDNDAYINAEIRDANNIFNNLSLEDTFQYPDSRDTAQYMSNVLTALGEFRKILVDFQGLLQADVNRASGVILPGTSGGFTAADIRAARAEGKAEAEREEAEKDAAEAAATEKAEKDKEITAAEVGAVVGVVGVLGYLAAKAADLLD